MVYLIHYTNAQNQVSHHVVFVKGCLLQPKEVYVFSCTSDLLASLKRLGLPYQRVTIPHDEREHTCPVCNAIRR